MHSTKEILRSAKHFFAGTFLSRVSGLVRDMAMAFCFGAGPEIASFMVAYRLANLLRRLFGEGNLQSGFIPHFEEIRAKNESDAFSFYRNFAYFLFIGLSGVVLALEGVLWILLRFLSVEWQEIVKLSMWMAPGLLFICFSALNSAFLQCQKRYFIPAASPILFNAVWIYFALFSDVYTLSIGITIAFAAQWLATTFQVRCELKKRLQNFHFPRTFPPEWKKVMKAMGLGIVGMGAMQINSAVDTIFARISDLSGPTYLWYAIRLQQLPLALFGIAITTALLPPLSRAAQEGDQMKYRQLFSAAFKQASFLIIPCFFGLFALASSGINLLYGRGRFNPIDEEITLHCLWGYSLGLIPAAFVLLLAAGSFAKKSYLLPSKASLISVGFNLTASSFFVLGLHLGPLSIALATACSAWVNFFLLFKRELLEPEVGKFLTKVTFASFFAAAISIGFGFFLGDCTLDILMGKRALFSRDFLEQMLQFGAMSLIFIGSFYMMIRPWKFTHEKVGI